MILWCIQVSIISIVIIYLIHQIIIFLKTTYTVPQVKDYIDQPKKQYDKIYQTINSSNNSEPSEPSEPSEHASFNRDEMKNQLQNYLKEEHANDTLTLDTDDIPNTTSISDLESASNI